MDKFWYACYGSNLLEERFNCYIEGGQPEGATRSYQGCRDNTLPEKSLPFKIPHKLYFAKSAKTWNGGGVGFIHPQADHKVTTYGKAYLINETQFNDLVKQEIDHQGTLSIDYDKAQKNGHLTFKEDAWYGRLIYLGKLEKRPVFTFTHSVYLKHDINPPDVAYLSTIIKGLKSSYTLSPDRIRDYLCPLAGIKGFDIAKALEQLI